MPPLPEARTEIYEFYKLAFLEDGYPGQRTDRGTQPHPMYGAYVAVDYANEYARTKDTVYLDAMVKVLNAAISRMEWNDGALIFYFDESDGLSYFPGKFYSGLVQARYLVPFATAHRLTGDEAFEKAALGILSSLERPGDEGGVAIQTPYGPLIEEYPHAIPTYVLNGWTTVIRELISFGERFDNERALAIARENLATLEKILPLFDVEDIANSRYQLTGFMHHRFVLPSNGLCRIDSFDVDFGGATFESQDSSNRWFNFVVDRESDAEGYPADRVLLANVVLSRISYPEPNTIRYQLYCKDGGAAKYEVAEPVYDPGRSALATKGWVPVSDIQLHQGVNEVEIEIPWGLLPLTGYPTNFAKNIAGGQYNVYHYLHIINLERLIRFYPSEVLSFHAEKWKSYVRRWSAMPVYDGYELTCVSALEGKDCPVYP